MARPFEFNAVTLSQARHRQHGFCACCGEDLADLVEHGHHVVPNQSGAAGNAAHRWLASVDNCVVLCAPCHERVHQDGHFRSGAVAPPDYYPHSHGGNKALHQHWVQQMRLRTRSVWP